MKAVILFGHGSRDPLWRQPIEAVASRIAASRSNLPVACAYLELDSPDLATATSGLLARGATEISILPVFLGAGRHAREDLPRLVTALQAQHPDVVFTLKPALGDDARVLDLIASIALE